MEFLRLIMTKKSFTTLNQLKQKRAEIYKIADRYGVSNIRVFGSVARGEEKKNSDVDLLTTLNSGISLFGLVKLEMLLTSNLGKKNSNYF